MHVPHIGVITEDDRFHWWISEPHSLELLGGHECRFALQGYIEDQRKEDFHRALGNTLSADESVLTKAEPHVLQYCREMLSLDIPQAPPALQLKRPSDVWKHVRFGNEIDVSRRDDGDEEDAIYLSLECGCDWEIEHGLQMVLRNGIEITKIGPFDGHLTNADAFGDPTLRGVVYRSIH